MWCRDVSKSARRMAPGPSSAAASQLKRVRAGCSDPSSVCVARVLPPLNAASMLKPLVGCAWDVRAELGPQRESVSSSDAAEAGAAPSCCAVIEVVDTLIKMSIGPVVSASTTTQSRSRARPEQAGVGVSILTQAGSVSEPGIEAKD